MALQMTIISSTGIQVEDAYIKVDEYACFKDTVNAKIRAYVSRELSESGASAIEGIDKIYTLNVDYSDGAVNTKKQIYEYIKSLPDFLNAIDV